MKQPNVSVGIISNDELKFAFNGSYTAEGSAFTGEQTARIDDGKVLFGGKHYDELTFQPDSPDASFTLHQVIIGVSFHWRRAEDQTFSGSLKLIVEGDKLTAVNILPVEDYLLSVISSEMSAKASLELLKAHAVISRSWLLAQIHKTDEEKNFAQDSGEMTDTDDLLIKWWDRDDHQLRRLRRRPLPTIPRHHQSLHARRTRRHQRHTRHRAHLRRQTLRRTLQQKLRRRYGRI